nr:PREDICTED: uncharacterized protein LOC109435217 [Rhinolophus sinicus]
MTEPRAGGRTRDQTDAGFPAREETGSFPFLTCLGASSAGAGSVTTWELQANTPRRAGSSVGEASSAFPPPPQCQRGGEGGSCSGTVAESRSPEGLADSTAFCFVRFYFHGATLQLCTLGCLGASSFLPFLLLLPLVRPQPSSGPVSRKPGRQSPPWPLYRAENSVRHPPGLPAPPCRSAGGLGRDPVWGPGEGLWRAARVGGTADSTGGPAGAGLGAAQRPGTGLQGWKTASSAQSWAPTPGGDISAALARTAAGSGSDGEGRD